MPAQLRASILFITALEEERNALLAQLEDPRQSIVDEQHANAYHEARVSNYLWPGESIPVAVLCLAGMGRVRAAVQTANAINDLQPSVVLLVGIAGGVRSAASALGNVIVGDQIFDYEQQKIDDDRNVIRPEVYRADPILLRVARETADAWNPGRDLVRAVEVKVGPIASGDKVVASTAHLEKLQNVYPKLLGVEMEGGGVAAAAWFSPQRPRFLMIRGVSDFADVEKNTPGVESLRPLACQSAALFAVELARRLPDLSTERNVIEENEREREKHRLLATLDELKQRLLVAKISGQETASLQDQILKIRRELRSGPSLSAGDHLYSGRYELLERLGAGGFATVWKCADRRAFEIVAVKVLHGQWVGDATRMQRFVRGALQMQRLAHPNVVRVLEAVREEDGHHFFVMEYLDGGTFEEAIQKGKLNAKQAVDVVITIGGALSYAHLQGAIHRDVKPQNILLASDGRTKLTDFDLVRALDTTGGTREGALGTLVYSSPECLSDASLAEEKSDVYSLAMVLLFALRREKLPLEAIRDTPALIDSCSASDAMKIALRHATEWRLSARTASVEKFCKAVQQGFANYIGGAKDLPDWLQRREFTESCRSGYLSIYADLRARSDWPRLEQFVGECALAILDELSNCFVKGAAPFGDSRSVVTSFNAVALEARWPLSPTLDKSEEKIFKWLVVRRIVLGVAKQFRSAIGGERRRLEALLIGFLNIAASEARTEGFLKDEIYRRYVTTFRPAMTNLGLVPSSLAKGPESLPTLGEYEREWLASRVPDTWPYDLPVWWH